MTNCANCFTHRVFKCFSCSKMMCLQCRKCRRKQSPAWSSDVAPQKYGTNCQIKAALSPLYASLCSVPICALSLYWLKQTGVHDSPVRSDAEDMMIFTTIPGTRITMSRSEHLELRLHHVESNAFKKKEHISNKCKRDPSPGS